jgi:hypothetical protein
MLASSMRVSRAILPRAPVAVFARRYASVVPPAGSKDPPPPPQPLPPLPPAPPRLSSPAPPGLELLSPVWTRITDLTVEKAEGSWVWATDGKKYLIKNSNNKKEKSHLVTVEK